MHDFGPKFLPRLGGLIAAALLLHAVILGGADWVWPQASPPPLPTAALQVRVVEPAEALAAFEPADVIAPRPVKAAVVRIRPNPLPMAVAKVVPVVAKPFADRVVEPVALPPLQLAAAAAVAALPVNAEARAEDDPIPLYRTQLPPAATLRYDISRGALRGSGELVWRPQAGAYELKLDFRLAGITLLSQASVGSIDAAGIAPRRFTDQRARRGTTAANFQRGSYKGGEKGDDKITYSGSQSEFALKPGAQDRLSWMLQLAAIVSAEPQLGAPGARVVMQVTGSRGDAGLWVFRCVGAEAIDARGGAVDTLKFVREPREAYDTTVQVWLDPKQHHLPVRATQKSGGSDEGFELRLVEVTAAN